MAKGDHIKVKRFVYSQHGIDICDGTVVHYTGLSGKKSEVKQTSMQEFLDDGGKLEIVKHNKSFTDDEVIKKALSCLGKQGYNLIFYNCEHFARWCKTGEKKSEQVNNAVKGYVGAATASSTIATANLRKISGGMVSYSGVAISMAAPAVAVVTAFSVYKVYKSLFDDDDIVVNPNQTGNIIYCDNCGNCTFSLKT
jgi:phage pi2 protein 07